MHSNQHDLHIAFSLTIARDIYEPNPDATDAVSATVSFAYCADGVRCDGEINLRISLDE